MISRYMSRTWLIEYMCCWPSHCQWPVSEVCPCIVLFFAFGSSSFKVQSFDVANYILRPRIPLIVSMSAVAENISPLAPLSSLNGRGHGDLLTKFIFMAGINLNVI